MSTPVFRNAEWFHIEGRGDVASVRLDRDCLKDELLATFKHVVIDGKNYEVKGVESWALQTIREGQMIGLLVDKR